MESMTFDAGFPRRTLSMKRNHPAAPPLLPRRFGFFSALVEAVFEAWTPARIGAWLESSLYSGLRMTENVWTETMLSAIS
jgi:hypothetical protein